MASPRLRRRARRWSEEGPDARGDIVSMLEEAFQEWNEDNAPRLGAALSYYTIFSIAPLLLISIAVAALVFGPDAAQGASWPCCCSAS